MSFFKQEGEGIEQVIDRHADIKVARSIYQTSVKRYPGRLIIAPVANDPNVWSGRLPPLLQGFDAVPPLVTDIDLSMDDRFLYVSCWGTGEMRQYDVTDPRKLKLAGSVRIGGIARRSQHPSGKQ